MLWMLLLVILDDFRSPLPEIFSEDQSFDLKILQYRLKRQKQTGTAKITNTI